MGKLSRIIDLPWLIESDFNAIFDAGDKRGGTLNHNVVSKAF